MRILIKGAIIGIFSGVLLGLFLKLVEEKVGTKVYTLLLNVDYIPYIKEIHLSEVVEFFLHLIISIMLSIILLLVITKYRWNNREIIIRTVLICLFIGIFLYPTTALSERTPPITSFQAIAFWLIGHIGYGFILASFFIKKSIKNES
ncbi:hypothetical protein [Bacillus sp. AK128]